MKSVKTKIKGERRVQNRVNNTTYNHIEAQIGYKTWSHIYRVWNEVHNGIS